MSTWGWCVVAIVAVPVLPAVRWLISDWRRTRRRARFLGRQQLDWSVAAIVARVEQERADAAVSWPTADPEATEVLPVVRTEDAPTEVLPQRVRRYVQNPPRPYPRTPQTRPDSELMQRVLEGLWKLDDGPSAAQ